MRIGRQAFRLLAVAGCVSALFCGPAGSAESRVGMLTCLADAPAGDKDASWPISCTYEPVKGGTVQRFDGSVLGMAAATRREGKAMMLWAVISEAPDIGPGDLADTYKADSSKADSSGPAVMVGQASKVILQPIDPTEQSANVAHTLRVIQLTLPKA